MLLSAIRATGESAEMQADITSCIYEKGTSITYAAWQDNLPENQPATDRSEV